MSQSLNSLAQVAGRWKRWVAAAQAPEEAHRATWAQLETLLGASPFWRQRVGERVPPLAEMEVTTYEDYRDAFERSWPGEVSELTGEPIVQWVVSSGTSGAQKKFPWTPTFRAQFREGMQLTLPFLQALSRYQGKPDRHLRIAPVIKGVSPCGVPVGYATAMEFPNDGVIYPDEVNATPDRFLRWLPLYALAADLQSLFSATSEPILQILERVQREPDFYLGHLRGELERPADLRPAVVSPQRLAFLERLLTSGEPLTPDTLWPELRLIQTWRAGPAGLQARRLASRCGEQVRFVDLTYGSTEGPIANPIELDAVGGPLHAGSVLHEFAEFGATPSPDNLLKPWELEPGGSYEVLLTTGMGMVRYRLGDVVTCTGRFHRVPTLRYQRRVKAELSLGLTTFAEDELVQVMDAVEVPPDLRYVFGPSEDGRSLVMYTQMALGEAVAARLHEVMAGLNETYQGLVVKGWTARLGAEHLPAEHPVWEHCRAKHAMAKPVLLLHEPPSAFR